MHEPDVCSIIKSWGELVLKHTVFIIQVLYVKVMHFKLVILPPVINHTNYLTSWNWLNVIEKTASNVTLYIEL